MKRLELEVPDQLHEQMETLVHKGWFRDLEEVAGLAIRRLLDVHRQGFRAEPGGVSHVPAQPPPVIDLGDEEAYAAAPVVRKLVHMVLLLALKDRASEIRVETLRGECKLSVCVGGTFYELVPPPFFLAPRIVNVIKLMADLDIIKRRVAQQGLMRVAIDEGTADLEVQIRPTEFGECATLKIIIATEPVADRAAQILNQWMRDSEGNLLLEFEEEVHS